MNMRERFEDAYPPRLNGGFCKDRNWYERKDDGRWYPDIERNHQWNIWQKAWQACEASQTQQNAKLLNTLKDEHARSFTRIGNSSFCRWNNANDCKVCSLIAKAGVK